jgi:hypothetical protein
MRVIKEIARPDCKITFYGWNNRYIIKIEQGLLEQTFKVNEYDVAAEEDLQKLLDSAFLAETLHRFDSMSHSLHSALNRI